MSGPKRELPPLYVTIKGNASSAISAMRKVADAAKSMNKEIAEARNENLKAIKEQNKAEREEQRRHLKQMQREMQEFLGQGVATGKDAYRLLPAFKKAQTAFAKEMKRIGTLDELVARAEDAETAARKVRVARRVKLLKEQDKYYANLVKKEDAANAKRARQEEQRAKREAEEALAEERRVLRRSRLRKRNYLLRKKQEAEELAAEERRVLRRSRLRKRNYLLRKKQEAEELAAEERRVLRRSRLRKRNYLLRKKQEAEELAAEERHALRRSRLRTIRRLQAIKEEREAKINSFLAQGKRIFGGVSGMGAMGARADMFMHAGVLQNITNMTRNFLIPYAEVENATIEMKAYTGTLEEAKKIIAEMQDYAVKSPYQLGGVLQATSMMMKYGASAENAMEMTKMLGDVAAGNTDRLKLLALAVGQAQGFGRLQGQELRQLVNAGFNPLMTAARELAGPGADETAIKKQMDRLQDAMRRRQLSSDIIKAALEVETSEGGRFAGMALEQAKTLTGWANQFIETLDLIKIQITEIFADDLKEGMKMVVRYTEAIKGWIQTNKEVVKAYVELGLKIMGAIVLFHALAFAVASAKWIMIAFMTVLGPLRLALTIVTFAVQALTVAITILRTKSLATWLTMLGPIIMAKIGIVGIISAVGALIAVMRGLAHEDGFSGMVKGWIAYLMFFLGWLYNFRENVANIWKYIAVNWKHDLTSLVYSLTIGIVDIIATAVASLIGFGDSVRAAFANLKADIFAFVGAPPERDTSMFNTNLPDFEQIKKQINDALAGFMPSDDIFNPKPKPDIDFEKFLKGGSDADITPAPAHALRNSADHATRMWLYGERAKAAMAAPAETHEKKVESLLKSIERNTRANSGALEVEDASLAVGATP
jgi:hypothetical protein